jgi:hypothetical protein
MGMVACVAGAARFRLACLICGEEVTGVAGITTALATILPHIAYLVANVTALCGYSPRHVPVYRHSLQRLPPIIVLARIEVFDLLLVTLLAGFRRGNARLAGIGPIVFISVAVCTGEVGCFAAAVKIGRRTGMAVPAGIVLGLSRRHQG